MRRLKVSGYLPVRYKAGYKYQLVSPVILQTNFRPKRPVTSALGRVSLLVDGKLCFAEGYCWDGPSGPIPDLKSYMRASLGHDGLYELSRQERIPFDWWRESDYHYGRWLKEDGAWTITVKTHLAGLKLANGSAAHPRNRKKIHEAP